MNKRFAIPILLFFILVIATAFRTWNLQNNPAGFFVDEASNARNAYSILITGNDTRGRPFPVLFEGAGDYRDPVYIYSAVPVIAIFGLSEFSIRLTSALYGIVAVVMIYFVGKEYFSKEVGLWSALFLAISPWHIHFSRVGFQLIASVFWVLFGLYFIHKSFNQIRYYFLAAVGFTLAFFSYSATKLYLPFIGLFLLYCYLKDVIQLQKKKVFWFVNVIVIATVLILIYPHLTDGTFLKRWYQVQQNHNLLEVGQAYLHHYSPSFLFISGDAGFPGQEVQRHSIHGVGELHWFQITFLLIALSAFVYLKKERNKLMLFILLFFIYPIGSIFTDIKPQATRTIIGVIPFTILSAYGIQQVVQLLKTPLFRNLFYATLGTGIAIACFLLVIALKNYPLQGSGYWGWQYGYRPAIEYAKAHYDEYYSFHISHRYNSGQELLDYYYIELQCVKCTTLNNPIKIHLERKELFMLREADILEAAEQYPELSFIELDSLNLPNGNKELSVGVFSKNE